MSRGFGALFFIIATFFIAAPFVFFIVNQGIYHRVNVDGTVNMLLAARSAGVKKFVYAASASCYGIPRKFPTPETAPIHPQYPYALTKYIGEQYVLHWGMVYQLPVVSLRLFNVYGPWPRSFLMHVFKKSANDRVSQRIKSLVPNLSFNGVEA